MSCCLPGRHGVMVSTLAIIMVSWCSLRHHHGVMVSTSPSSWRHGVHLTILMVSWCLPHHDHGVMVSTSSSSWCHGVHLALIMVSWCPPRQHHGVIVSRPGHHYGVMVSTLAMAIIEYPATENVSVYLLTAVHMTSSADCYRHKALQFVSKSPGIQVLCCD